MIQEEKRLHDAHTGAANWYLFGLYLGERQWGTVHEDYSSDSDAWTYSTHDMARSKAHRWGEDGIAGICDNETNTERLYHTFSGDRFFKDGVNDHLVYGHQEAINPAMQGTKAAIHYTLTIQAGGERVVRLRLADITCKKPFDRFDTVVNARTTRTCPSAPVAADRAQQ